MKQPYKDGENIVLEYTNGDTCTGDTNKKYSAKIFLSSKSGSAVSFCFFFVFLFRFLKKNDKQSFRRISQKWFNTNL